MRPIILLTLLLVLVLLLTACSSGRMLRSRYRNRQKGHGGYGGYGSNEGGGKGGQKGGRGERRGILSWLRRMRSNRGCRRPLFGRSKGGSSEKGSSYGGYSGYTGYTGYTMPTVMYWSGGYGGNNQKGYGWSNSQESYKGYTQYNTGYTGYNNQKGYNNYNSYKGRQPTHYPTYQVNPCCTGYAGYKTQQAHGGYNSQNVHNSHKGYEGYSSQKGYDSYNTQKGYGDHNSNEYISSFTHNSYQKPVKPSPYFISNSIQDTSHSSEFGSSGLGGFQVSTDPLSSYSGFSKVKGSDEISKTSSVFGSIETDDADLENSSNGSGFTSGYGGPSGKITLSGIQSSSKL